MMKKLFQTSSKSPLPMGPTTPRDFVERSAIPPPPSPDNPNDIDPWGRGLLHVAAAVGSVSCVQYIVARGCQYDLEDEDGLTAADMAVSSSHPAALKAMGCRGITARGLAIAQWRLDVSKDPTIHLTHGGPAAPHFDPIKDDTWTLAERGLLAGIHQDTTGGNQKGVWGKSPLHYACTVGHADVAVVMLKMGWANPSRKDFFGWTPLHYAVKNGHMGCVEAVVKFGGLAKEAMEGLLEGDGDLLYKYRSMVCAVSERACDAELYAVHNMRSSESAPILARIAASYGRPADAVTIGRMVGLLPWSTEGHGALVAVDQRKIALLLYVLRREISDDVCVCAFEYVPLRLLP